jgi:uncharacterized protein YyaL (SSP411 family)
MANRLQTESSPYLRQHAENPVEWFPWGEEALALAAERDVPVLLSIGYSSCHWCHVMAHESFENADTAAYMNEHFVNVKVDREERPDIDAIYMEAAQAMSGHGGWPLTAFLTPGQVPFFAGTYFPPEPRPGMPSFMQVMESIVEVWETNRTAIDERSALLVDQLKTTSNLRAPEDPISRETTKTAIENLRRNFDPDHGGYGGAPKFPPHSVLEFLLASSDAGGADRAAALFTLRKIAEGGINDHLAGGFARYSVDERWHVPHFEKMLYDNALLARAYLHAFLSTGEKDYADAARSTLDWMIEEMYVPEEGFASALDADSPDADGRLEEGAFYAWDFEELREVLADATPDHVDELCAYWGARQQGEFEGKNVLHVADLDARPPEAVLRAAKQALLDRRAQRARPAQDDKRITAWNALAIRALALAGPVLGDERYSEIAIETAGFLEQRLTTDDGRLLRSWTAGRPGGPGFLEDHAQAGLAYLSIYERTGDERWFKRADQLADHLIERFEDNEHGGFFTTATDHEQLLVRRKDIEDNPLPSGNSAAAQLLLAVAHLTGSQRHRQAATRSLQAVQSIAARLPLGFGCALEAIDYQLGPVKEVVLVGPPEQRARLEHVVLAEHRPRMVLAQATDAESTMVPLLEARGLVDGQAAAYVCENFTCELPVTTPALLSERLQG